VTTLVIPLSRQLYMRVSTAGVEITCHCVNHPFDFISHSLSEATYLLKHQKRRSVTVYVQTHTSVTIKCWGDKS